MRNARIVDQDVETTQRRHGIIHHLLTLARIGHIRFEGGSVLTHVLNIFRCFASAFQINIRDGNVRAALGKLKRRRATNSFSAAGDQDNLVIVECPRFMAFFYGSSGLKCAESPPSASTSLPVMYEDSSDAKNCATLAI